MGTAAPVMTHKVMPIYPGGAIKAGISGNVTLEAIVGTDGQIHGARVIASQVEAGLEHAAFEAIQQWTYRPGTLEGKRVPVVFTIQVEFGVSRR